jgi:hypothetical protein
LGTFLSALDRFLIINSAAMIRKAIKATLPITIPAIAPDESESDLSVELLVEPGGAVAVAVDTAVVVVFYTNVNISLDRAEHKTYSD